MTDFDGIIVGGGHNGLVCANYLARAGQRVLVLEATGRIGGGLKTEEGDVAGVRHNTHAVVMRWTPDYRIYRDLELDRFDLRVVTPAIQYAQPFRDGRCIVMAREPARTLETIARIDAQDARTFARLRAQVEDLFRQILAVDRFAAPLPPDEAADLLARSAAGRQYLEFSRASVLELIEANFRSDPVQSMLGFVSSVRGHLPVLDMPGTGLVLPVLLHAVQGGSLVVGGSERLAEALVRALYAHGGRVLKNHRVDRILVEGGRAVGVQARGREFRARGFVASSLPPQQSLLDLAGREYLDASLVDRIRAYRPKAEALFGLHATHTEAPRYRAAEREPDVQQAMLVNLGYETLADIKADMRDVRSGTLPAQPKMAVVGPTTFDPSQAPAGLHATLLWQFAPCQLHDGGIDAWQSQAVPYGRAMLRAWGEYAPEAAGDSLLDWFVHSPLDTQRTIPSMVLGDRHHGEYLPQQMGFNRPLPELSQYATPVDRLYLCGSSTHPGGSITGCPGYNAATRIASDLDLPLWWNPPDLRQVLANLR